MWVLGQYQQFGSSSFYTGLKAIIDWEMSKILIDGGGTETLRKRKVDKNLVSKIP